MTPSVASPGERARRQKAELRRALVEAVTSNGYEASGIAEVCDLSGLPRSTFHTHYDDFAACFEDVCFTALEAARSAVMSGWRSAHGWDGRLRSACAELLAHVERSADHARAALLESLRAGPAAAETVRHALSLNERPLALAFQLHPEGFPTSRLAPRSIVGGVRHVLGRRLEGEGPESPLDELVDWVCCFRARSIRRLMRLAASEPPPGAAELIVRPVETDAARVREALIHAMLQDGRQSLEEDTLARFAGITTEQLQQAHGGVPGALKTLVKRFDAEAEEAILSAYGRAEDWASAVRAAVHAAALFLTEDREMSLVRMVGLSIVPSVAVQHEDGFAEMLLSAALRDAPTPRHARGIAREALLGAVGHVLRWHVSTRSTPMRGFADQLSFILLAPYLGPEEAACAVADETERERGGG